MTTAVSTFDALVVDDLIRDGRQRGADGADCGGV